MKTIKRLVIAALFIGLSGTVNAEIYAFDFKGQCLTTEFDNFIPRHEADSWAQTAFPEYRELGEKARMAKFNVQVAYDFFLQEFQWRSIDNQDTDILLFANYAGTRSDDCDSYNAYFWQNEVSAAEISILAGFSDAPTGIGHDLDVVGHEFGHGIYRAGSGGDGHLAGRALNDSVADMVGVTVRAWFESGKSFENTVVRADSFESGKHFMTNMRMAGYSVDVDFLRDIANPTRHGGISHTDDLEAYMLFIRSQNAEADHYEVGGITSLAYALMVKGGQHPVKGGDSLEPMGFKTSFSILMYVIKNKLPFNDNEDFASALAYAASNMYGAQSPEHLGTVAAFNAVGVSVTELMPPAVPTEPPVPDVSIPTPPLEQEPSVPTPDVSVPTSTPILTDTSEPNISQATPSTLSLNGPMVLMMLGGVVVLLSMTVIFLSGKRNKEVQAQMREADVPLGAVLDTVLQDSRKVETTPHVPDPTPHIVKTHKITTEQLRLDINGYAKMVELQNSCVEVGRTALADIDQDLSNRLADDPYISRRHARIDYFEAQQEVKITCLSDNGLTINGMHELGANEKARISINRPVVITLGKTKITVSKV